MDRKYLLLRNIFRADSQTCWKIRIWVVIFY